MAATLKDIAGRAGVSLATVSLVLNGKGDISAATRARVLAAAADLGYARRRARGGPHRPATVGFLKIACHGHTVNRDHNGFIADYLDGLSQAAAALGYRLEVISHEGAPLAGLASALAGPALAGLVVLGTELGATDVERLRGAAGIPVVFIDTWFDGVDASFVDMNNADAVARIVDHFVERGLGRIGCITSAVATENFRLRQVAFVNALAARGLAARPDDILVVDSTFDGAHRDLAARLDAGLDLAEGYFCANDIIMLGCIRALREAGLAIPADVSLVGFDNLPMSAAMAPALTTVDVSKRKIGETAIRLLDDQIRGAGRQPTMKVLVGTDLVIRDSVRPRSEARMAGIG